MSTNTNSTRLHPALSWPSVALVSSRAAVEGYFLNLLHKKHVLLPKSWMRARGESRPSMVKKKCQNYQLAAMAI